MADAGIKKVTVLAKNLPPLIVFNQTDVGKYYLRFRIVSEDSSKRSAFSPVNIVDGLDLTDIVAANPVDYQYYSDEESFRINWSVPEEIERTRFDVYARWSATEPGLSSQTYSFVGPTVDGAQTTLTIPATNSAFVQVRVQLETDPHILNNPAKLFETAAMSTALTNLAITSIDGGSIV